MMNNTSHRWEKLWDRDLNSIDQEIVLGYCHLWQYPTTNCGLVEAPLVPQLVA